MKSTRNEGPETSSRQTSTSRKSMRFIGAVVAAAVVLGGLGDSRAVAGSGTFRHLPTSVYCFYGSAQLTPHIGPAPGYEYGQLVAYRFWIQDARTGAWYVLGNDRWGDSPSNWYWKYTRTAAQDVTYITYAGLDTSFPNTSVLLAHGHQYRIWTEAYWYDANNAPVGSDVWLSVYAGDSGLFADVPMTQCNV